MESSSDISIESDSENKSSLENIMQTEYSYPDPDDPDLQQKLYKKREFYYHKPAPRPEIKKYEDLKEYRDNICGRNFSLHDHQAMLSNFINPDTPYKGLLVFHGLGSGKCCSRDTVVKINNVDLTMSFIWEKYRTSVIVKKNDDQTEGEGSVPSNTLTLKTYNENAVRMENGIVL